MEIVSDFIELHENGLVSWEEVESAIEGYFLALSERRPPVPLRRRYRAFTFNRLSDEEILKNFRFRREDLPRLKRCLESKWKYCDRPKIENRKGASEKTFSYTHLLRTTSRTSDKQVQTQSKYPEIVLPGHKEAATMRHHLQVLLNTNGTSNNHSNAFSYPLYQQSDSTWVSVTLTTFCQQVKGCDVGVLEPGSQPESVCARSCFTSRAQNIIFPKKLDLRGFAGSLSICHNNIPTGDSERRCTQWRGLIGKPGQAVPCQSLLKNLHTITHDHSSTNLGWIKGRNALFNQLRLRVQGSDEQAQTRKTSSENEPWRLRRKVLDLDALPTKSVYWRHHVDILDDLRRSGWPGLLGISSESIEPAPSESELRSHPEYGQVVLDVNRSIKRFPPWNPLRSESRSSRTTDKPNSASYNQVPTSSVLPEKMQREAEEAARKAIIAARGRGRDNRGVGGPIRRQLGRLWRQPNSRAQLILLATHELRTQIRTNLTDQELDLRPHDRDLSDNAYQRCMKPVNFSCFNVVDLAKTTFADNMFKFDNLSRQLREMHRIWRLKLRQRHNVLRISGVFVFVKDSFAQTYWHDVPILPP
ncbi:unnamed protein product [Nesidiocoris tenuis]|uniref:Uncharacterized protein n=1 Tax=Nesidiocoris tenuis TaxID=355587 RepID=A0A6H5H5Q0_9HEMI|nr:unnamed protein product [Nesidiocoris tenuis]